MDQHDVAGVLQTYSARAAKAVNTRQLRIIVKNLKEILDLRSIRVASDEE